MSRCGNPYDNAQAESFIKTLKAEVDYVDDYETSEDVADDLPNFIENIYDRSRLDSALGNWSPDKLDEINAPAGSRKVA